MINLPPKTKKYLWLGLKITGAAVVLGIILWLAVISPYLTRKEKLRFETAATELEKLSQEIQTKIGIATSDARQKACDRPNLKFAKGPLSCDVSSDLKYNVSGADEANDLLERVAVLNPKPLRPGPLTKSVHFTENGRKTVQIIYQDIITIENLSCSLSFEFYPHSDKQEGASSPLLRLVHSCGGPARAEHYPVEE